MFSIDGLVSGFDTTSIIEGLLQFQQSQVDLFNQRKSEIVTRQTAFNGIEAQLLSLRTSLGRLNRNAAFDARSVSSSNENVIAATASSDAATGTFSITVNQLATAEQLGSQGFASENATVATGDLTIRVGSGDSTTIQIDESNNTVDGLVDAINAQSDDVAASLVFDQASDSYRILLTSSVTGEENTIEVTSNLDSGTGEVPDFSGPPVQAATNASITLGSGDGAITAEYDTNQIDELISGVTLDLVAVDANPVTVSVTADNTAATGAIEEFVDAFNSVIDFIDAQTQFDPETNFASPLLGNRNVNSIRDELVNIAIENIPGLDVGLSRLADIGIDIDTTGRLTLDKTQLTNALNGDVEGINPADIRNLFGLNGSSSNQGIEFLLGSDRTTASGEPIEVDIIQAAEQASITSTGDVAETTVIDETNNELTITIDGAEAQLTLESGTYTQAELAAQVQSVINASSDLGSRDVTVSVDNNQLTITTESYGSSSEITGLSGSALRDLGLSGSESGTGRDVAGTFIVNGQTETAVGNGRILVGDSENANTADLQVLVTLSTSQVDTGGVEGTITVSRGASSQLDQFLNDVLDPDDGTLQIINEDFDSRIESLDESIQRVNDLTESRRAFLVAEFAALETVLADLQNTGNILTSQLAALAPPSRN